VKKPSGLQLGAYLVSVLLIGVGIYATIWPFAGVMGFPTTRYSTSGTYPVTKDFARIFGVVSLLFGLGLIYFIRGGNEDR